MQHCDTLIAPTWCIPIEPSNAVLIDHAIVIDDGRIIDLLPLAQATEKYQASITLNRPNHVALPGFVNAHTHAAMTLMRGLADDLPLEPWLTTAIWPAEKRWLSEEMVRDGTELAIAEMIRGGTTCFSDQYFFPEVVAESAVDLHMRAMIGTPILEFPTAWAGTVRESLEKASDLVHDPYADHPLITTCFAPHSTYSLSDDAFIELRTLADQLDVPTQIHLHESAAEVDGALRETGRRPFDRLQELGLVNDRLLAVHAVHLSDSEISTFSKAGVNIAHCPISNLKLASGIAPIAKYRDAGINVAIGTDGAASNNVLDMLSELRTAALLAKATANDAAAVTAYDALRMATLDGAKALGIDTQTGSIRSGKWADITCIDLDTLNSQPVYDPISQVVYSARADQVSDVWIAGRHQLENGKLKHIDTENLRGRIREWQVRIASNSATSGS